MISARARIGLLAAAGAGLAGLAGLLQRTAKPAGGGGGTGNLLQQASKSMTVATFGGQTSTLPTRSQHQSGSGREPPFTTPAELDAFIRQVQRNGRCHIRTLTTLAMVNLICWVPLYIVALVAPVGT